MKRQPTDLIVIREAKKPKKQIIKISRRENEELYKTRKQKERECKRR